MRRHFVSGFPRALLSLGQEKSSGVEIAQTGSQFVYACAVDLRTSARKGEEKPSMQTTVSAVIFGCEWVFCSAHYMMTSVTGSNISLP